MRNHSIHVVAPKDTSIVDTVTIAQAVEGGRARTPRGEPVFEQVVVMFRELPVDHDIIRQHLESRTGAPVAIGRDSSLEHEWAVDLLTDSVSTPLYIFPDEAEEIW